MERKVVIIAGPTCSGKTSLSLGLASHLNSEIISADSRQVYKYLDIGTAKPSHDELNKVRHHFIDILSPEEPFDVKMFESSSVQIIKSLHQKGLIPVVAGGTGLYIKAITDGIFELGADSAEEQSSEQRAEGPAAVLRSSLRARAERGEYQQLYDELAAVDPVSSGKMLPQNYKRVIRALEVYYLTGRPIWQHQAEYKRDFDAQFHQFGLNWPREILYRNIELRVDEMISRGLLDEVSGLLEKGFSRHLNSLNTVGYKEMISYLDGQISFDEAVELIKRNTRRYAKRQMTWFRADKRITWLDIFSFDDLQMHAEKILSALSD